MRTLPLVLVLVLAGCAQEGGGYDYRPGAAHVVTVPDEVQARCDHVGSLHSNDGYGGIGPRAACIRYWQQTGELPPT
jgi:hypothetical protein